MQPRSFSLLESKGCQVSLPLALLLSLLFFAQSSVYGKTEMKQKIYYFNQNLSASQMLANAGAFFSVCDALR
jgi:hypothetical protein